MDPSNLSVRRHFPPFGNQQTTDHADRIFSSLADHAELSLQLILHGNNPDPEIPLKYYPKLNVKSNPDLGNGPFKEIVDLAGVLR